MFLLSQSIYPRPILYLCKQGVAALFSFFEISFSKCGALGPGPRTEGARAPHFENDDFPGRYRGSY